MALLGFVTIAAAAIGLWWVNSTGLPTSWRDQIEDTLASHGLHTDVTRLSYLPLRGIEADQVIIYSDKAHTRVIARLSKLLIEIDRTRLARGQIKIERLDLLGAIISLVADPADPNSKALEIEDARGRILMPRGRLLEIQSASGIVGGIRMQFDAALLMQRPRHISSPEEIAAAREQRKRILTGIIDSLDHWAPTNGAVPLIRIDAQGDLEDPGSLRATITAHGHDLNPGEFLIEQLNIQAELHGSTLVLHHGEIRSSNGHMIAQLEYDLSESSGHFHTNLSIDPDLKGLLTALDLPLPKDLPSFGSAAALEAHGSFAKHDEQWIFQVTGHTALDQPRFRQLSADHIASSFSWDGKRLFLEDLILQKAGESLSGRLFITPEIIRYQASSTLPLSFWQESIPFKSLSKVLAEFSTTDQSENLMTFEGTVNPADKKAWTFTGQAEASHISYRGVPAKFARVDLDLNHARLDFTKGEVEFDYRDYPLRKRHGGPDNGQIQVDRIRYDRPQATISIENIRGKAWPAPIIRTFSSSLADHIEGYGFHRPPQMAANGVIGIRDGVSKQNLLIDFSADASTDYTFVGEKLVMTEVEGQIHVLPKDVRISDLSFGLFGGLVRGELIVQTKGRSYLKGELDATKIDLTQLATTYGTKNPLEGTITGRLEFDMLGGNVSGLNGKGHLALLDGELVDIPLFGPLSPLIATVLGRHAAGFQEAKDAYFTFQIRKGILATQDLITTTPALVFTGDASVDMNDQTFEMTIRMNARGLLGIITLPLRPFYGLFQFRGSGPFRKPEWKKVMFTSPPEDQNDALLTPPKARPVHPPARR